MCVSTEADRKEAIPPSITARARDNVTDDERGLARNTQIAPIDPPEITNLTPGASGRSSAVRDSSSSEQFGQSSRDPSSSAADTQFDALAHNEGRGSIIEHYAEGTYGNEDQQSVHDAASNGIEVDNDYDSALGSDTQSITRSLDSSVHHYREEHGRTYHGYKDGKYYLPNDEPESDRLDFMHVAFRMTYEEKLFLAPVTNLRNALDVGTGTGIWAIDLADEYPECQVVGTDLSPGQPNLIPPNLKFIIDDAEDTWVFPNRFDLIHARLMVGSFDDWPKFFREAYRNLEPGGWLELQEFVVPVESHDGTHKNTNILKWGQLLCEAARRSGRPMGADVCDLIVQQMQDVGFIDVQQRNFAWPTNSWPKNKLMKELGVRTRISCTDGMEGLCLALLMRGLGWSKKEVDVFVALVKKDFNDRSIHAYIPMPVFFGRKPEYGAG